MTDILSVGGDSGAWVIDNASGRVCAHVLAWSARNNTAYIAPMEILLKDMTNVLGADVTLPGSERSESTTTPKEAPKVSSTLQNRIVDSNPNLSPSDHPSAPKFHQQLQPFLQKPLPPEGTHTSFAPHKSDVISNSNARSPNASPFKPYQHQNPYPTPSPSPPMPTSPPCHSLIDSIVHQQQSPNADPLRQLETTTSTAAATSRPQVLGRGGGGRGRGRGRGLEVDGMRAGGGVETRG